MSSPDCLFCKIAAKEIPATIVFENERLIAFDGIHPQAPTHVQIIPRKHIASTLEVADEDRELMCDYNLAIAELATRRAADHPFLSCTGSGIIHVC